MRRRRRSAILRPVPTLAEARAMTWDNVMTRDNVMTPGNVITRLDRVTALSIVLMPVTRLNTRMCPAVQANLVHRVFGISNPASRSTY